DPEFVNVAERIESGRRRIRVGIGQAEIDVFQVVEVTFPEFRIEVPVSNPAFTREHVIVLEVGGPDPAVRKSGRRQGTEGQRGVAAGVIESLHRIDLPIPGWISVAVRENVSGVIQDDVLDHVDSMRVRRGHEFAEIIACAKVRIDIKEVLYPVAVVGLLKSDLLEYGTDPDRGDAHALQIADLRCDSVQSAANPDCSGVVPFLRVRGSLNCISVVGGGIEKRRSAYGRKVAVVVEVALLVAIGESVGKEKIKNLIFPGLG